MSLSPYKISPYYLITLIVESVIFQYNFSTHKLSDTYYVEKIVCKISHIKKLSIRIIKVLLYKFAYYHGAIAITFAIRVVNCIIRDRICRSVSIDCAYSVMVRVRCKFSE